MNNIFSFIICFVFCVMPMCISFCFLIAQIQRGAGLAAAVALLWSVSSQQSSSEACSALSGVAPSRFPRLQLSAAAAELSEVSPTC